MRAKPPSSAPWETYRPSSAPWNFHKFCSRIGSSHQPPLAYHLPCNGRNRAASASPEHYLNRVPMIESYLDEHIASCPFTEISPVTTQGKCRHKFLYSLHPLHVTKSIFCWFFLLLLFFLKVHSFLTWTVSCVPSVLFLPPFFQVALANPLTTCSFLIVILSWRCTVNVYCMSHFCYARMLSTLLFPTVLSHISHYPEFPFIRLQPILYNPILILWYLFIGLTIDWYPMESGTRGLPCPTSLPCTSLTVFSASATMDTVRYTTVYHDVRAFYPSLTVLWSQLVAFF